MGSVIWMIAYNIRSSSPDHDPDFLPGEVVVVTTFASSLTLNLGDLVGVAGAAVGTFLIVTGRTFSPEWVMWEVFLRQRKCTHMTV